MDDVSGEDLHIHRLRSWERRTRFIVIWTLFVLLTLFYTVRMMPGQHLISSPPSHHHHAVKQLSLTVLLLVRLNLLRRLVGGAPP